MSSGQETTYIEIITTSFLWPHEQILTNIIFYSLVTENKDIDRFFSNLTHEEKKSIASLSQKLAQLVEQNAVLDKKVVGLTDLKRQQEEEINALKHENRNILQEEIKKLKKENTSLYTRLEMKSYLVEESDKEKKSYFKEKEDLISQIKNLNSLKEVGEILENTQNKAQWASGIRANQSVEEQAKIFYESFRVILSKETSLKSEVKSVMEKLEQTEKRYKAVSDDCEDIRKRYLNLKKKNQDFKTELAKANKKIEQLSQRVSEEGSESSRPTKKRKFNEITKNGNEIDLFINSQEQPFYDSQRGYNKQQVVSLDSQSTQNYEQNQHGTIQEETNPSKAKTITHSQSLKNLPSNKPQIGISSVGHQQQQNGLLKHTLTSNTGLFSNGIKLDQNKQQYKQLMQQRNAQNMNQKIVSGCGVQLGMSNYFKK